jgi:hypothetical protein
MTVTVTQWRDRIVTLADLHGEHLRACSGTVFGKPCFLGDLSLAGVVMAKSSSPLWFRPNRTEQNHQVQFTVQGYRLNWTMGLVPGSRNPLEM